MFDGVILPTFSELIKRDPQRRDSFELYSKLTEEEYKIFDRRLDEGLVKDGGYKDFGVRATAKFIDYHILYELIKEHGI